jgi:Activator of Hsp90 ATPase homolog 1-like protein
MQIVQDTPEQIVWRVTDGPGDWVGTTVTFVLQRRDDDGTTLLFTHSDWREANEFMRGCATNWGAYLTSLKSGAERGEFAAYPAGEMSRWS